MGRLARLLVTAWALLTVSAAAETLAERGRYLTIAGNCTSCHTQDAAFSGGVRLRTPFGTIYSSNITPDEETGIGAWSAEDFHRAMQEGRRPDGRHLYPAFPYTHFAKLTETDTDALFAYLRSLAPVRSERPRNELAPFVGYRGAIAIWNDLFFNKSALEPDPLRSPEWNRGAYLVEGLGHCGMCHTPRNALGGEIARRALQGGTLDGWHAPSIAGLASWSREEFVAYLRSGRTARAVASGPMMDVVVNSTSQLSEEDLSAIVDYLREVPAAALQSAAPAPPARGGEIYAATCVVCHGAAGEGTEMAPRLAGNSSVQARGPETLVRLVIEGSAAGMPSQALDDREIAAVLSYVRASFGNAAAPFTARQVARVRARFVED